MPMERLTIRIAGLHCASCSMKLESDIAAIPGVNAILLNFATEFVMIEYDPALTSQDALLQACEKKGFSPHFLGDVSQEIKALQVRFEGRRIWRMIIASSVLSVLSVLVYQSSPELFYSTFGFVIFAVPLFGLALARMFFAQSSTLKKQPLSWNMIFSSAGILLLYAYSCCMILFRDSFVRHGFAADHYFPTVSLVLTVFLVFDYFELRAKGLIAQVWCALWGAQVRQVVVFRSGNWMEIPADHVVFGDLIYVAPGDRVPVDGFIFRGRALINQSLVTGESKPVEKSAGEEVISGSQLMNGLFEMHAVNVGGKTVLARVISAVQSAQCSKGSLQVWLEQRARWVMLAIGVSMVLALTAWWFMEAECGYDLLVVSAATMCLMAVPCLIGYITSFSLLAGVGRCLKSGIVVRDATTFEKSRSISTIFFTKSGVLTTGHKLVEQLTVDAGAAELIKSFGLFQDAAIYVVTAILAVERHSKHPIAKAIQEFVENHYPRRFAVELGEFESVAGLGVRATIDRRAMLIGSKQFMERNAIVIPTDVEKYATRWSSQGKTPIYAALAGRLVAYMCVADPIRPEAVQAVTTLKRMGINAVLLTGDTAKTARAVAKAVGIDAVHYELAPEEKSKKIMALRTPNQICAAVGLNHNDFSHAADVSIALPQGTDILSKDADVVFLRDDLSLLPSLLLLSRKIVRNTKQNFIAVAVYYAFIVPLACGIFYPIMGLFLAPVAASIAAVSLVLLLMYNAMRLKDAQL